MPELTAVWPRIAPMCDDDSDDDEAEQTEGTKEETDDESVIK